MNGVIYSTGAPRSPNITLGRRGLDRTNDAVG
jgi:hypothetical protein